MHGAENYGREVSAVAHNDIAEVKRISASDKISDEDRELLLIRENMIIVQLNSGGLLLYAPVKIHDETELGELVRSLGDVKYIVAPSSEHNLQLPGIIKKYPDAKIVANSINERKLVHAKALPKNKIDFDYTKKEDLQNLNIILAKEGVQMSFIEGDVCTHSLFCVAHKVALECDIIYTHADGEGFLMWDRELFRKLDPKDFMGRIFKFRLLSKPNSPNGFLPPYRFWSMDPLFWPFMINPPAADGSSASLMAASLRTALNMEFDTATGVHFRRMSATEFRQTVDKNWNWLDGKSLLSK